MILLLLKSYLEIIFFWVALYEILKESGLPYFWCDEFNERIILAFGWVEVLHNTSICLIIVQPWFYSC